MKLLFLAVGLSISFLSADPFINMENAVGYIVIDKNGKSENYIVFETGKGEVKLVKIRRNPAKVLEKERGGKGR